MTTRLLQPSDWTRCLHCCGSKEQECARELSALEAVTQPPILCILDIAHVQPLDHAALGCTPDHATVSVLLKQWLSRMLEPTHVAAGGALVLLLSHQQHAIDHCILSRIKEVWTVVQQATDVDATRTSDNNGDNESATGSQAMIEWITNRDRDSTWPTEEAQAMRRTLLDRAPGQGKTYLVNQLTHIYSP